MALRTIRLDVDRFGGVNYADPPRTLYARAYTPTDSGFVQTGPLETSGSENMDFVETHIGKRPGSSEWVDLTALLQAGESLIDGYSWIVPGGDQENMVAVGTKSIYIKEGDAAFAQINDSASSAYTHSADVSKVTFAEVDNHLIIGIDGANKIQVYRTGADLDPELDNGNLYTEAFGGGTQTITGAWGTAYYNVTEVHGRLVFSKGDSVVEYTDIEQPWDRAGGGYHQFKSNVVAMTTFVPRGGNEYTEVLVSFTDAGIQILPGFSVHDAPMSITGTHAPISYRAVARMENWLVYLTKSGTIEATNLFNIIDLGRRLKKLDGLTGPLDTLVPANVNHPTKTFAIYDSDRSQTYIYYPEGANSVNGRAIVLDTKLGEPVPNEQLPSIETRMRPLLWTIKEPTKNPWFTGVFLARQGIKAVRASGKIYDHCSGLNDYGTIPIREYWDMPDWDSGLPNMKKGFRRITVESLPKGNWYVDAIHYLNRDNAQVGSGWRWLQNEADAAAYDISDYDTAVYVSGGTVQGGDWINLVGRALRTRFKNQQTSQDWVMVSISLEYVVYPQRSV